VQLPKASGALKGSQISSMIRALGRWTIQAISSNISIFSYNFIFFRDLTHRVPIILVIMRHTKQVKIEKFND
jgi:hypothetical protein